MWYEFSLSHQELPSWLYPLMHIVRFSLIVVSLFFNAALQVMCNAMRLHRIDLHFNRSQLHHKQQFKSHYYRGILDV